ncbi:MAG: tRNA (adenosine(37)-N6)-threonylcarbamoyltransferase complex dimerization subunit type 1 TsaB [Acutalibacteraceae bacterium]
MKILGVDSTATSASASVLSDDKILSLEFSNTGLTHSQTLLPMVNNALKTAKLSINDIDYFAVSNGPGSFTGVRIGVALIKGLSQPLNKKCVAISTLEVIAKPLENTGVLAVAVMDARCNQVYTAQFDCENGLNRVTPDEAITIDELTENLSSVNKTIVLIGDGANICFKKMKDVLSNVRIAPLVIRYQSAASVAAIAKEKIEADKDSAISSSELLPSYLRLSQAERELKKKNESK